MGDLNLVAPSDTAGLPHLADTLYQRGVVPRFEYVAKAAHGEITPLKHELPFRHLLRLTDRDVAVEILSLEVIFVALGAVILGFLFVSLVVIVVGWFDSRENFPREMHVRLYGAPGTRLINWTEFLFSRKDAEHLVQTILDMRLEYFEALAEKRIWKARVVLVRGYTSFFSAVGLHFSLRIGKRAVTMWKLLP
jgi:hypothetical protein